MPQWEMFIGAMRKRPGTGERGEMKRCSVTTTFRRRPFNRINPQTRFLPIAQGIYSQQLNWERWTLHPVSLCSCVSLKLPAYISKSSGPTSGRVSDGCYLNLSSNSIRFRRSQIGFECKNWFHSPSSEPAGKQHRRKVRTKECILGQAG